ncbi:hypothetical protein JMM81_22275 [Bacillus sp. V3B]|uniref:DUF5677 domain-containing protein n=1 Tax=Bacillus sp. V3B TaxID=2804915 RepID=UPI002108763C|nr:DUF5677 domain-containing protein [Bacillus sp. V3B]MCQ6277583.1 hypothetical protein [Bacillus sp. V3B]
MQPNKYLLDRKNDKEIQKILNRMGRLLDEVVNFGSHVLDICRETYNFTEYETPIATTYTEYLSLLDGITVLIKKGTGDPIKPLLRSMLEMKFNIEYLLDEEEKKGVLAYQVAHAQKKIANWKLVDPTTQQGKEFLKKTSDLGMDPSKFKPKENIARLERGLSKGKYKEVNEEWKRTKKEMGRRPSWYSLYNGPRGIIDLAKHLGQENYYEIIYRNLSRFLHGGSALDRITNFEEGFGVNPGIRRLEELPQHLNFAVVFALEIYHKMIKKYNPNKAVEYAQWYVDNIQNEFFELTQANITVEYISDRKQH